MADTHFKIIFEGTLRNGVDLETAKLNLAALFKSDTAVVERLFGGKAVILKRGLSQEKANQYLSALNDAGVEARIEPEPAPVVLQAEVREPDIYRAPLEQNAQDSSPYTPPRAPVGAMLSEYAELKVFSLQGRIGRVRYLAWSLVLMVALLVVTCMCAAMLTNTLVGGGLFITIVAVGFLIVSVQIGAQRLHDAGWSAWLLLINLIPFVGMFFPLLMMIIPGNTGANQYGAPEPPVGRGVKVLASMWVLFIAMTSTGLYIGGVNMFEEEVQTSATQFENTLPQDDDNDGDSTQPADTTPSVTEKDQ
ncbi:DUF805 domain-containing protein [Pseudomonas sp. NA-150]|uniref:DUF805 domain-containing protein n=1 Tax=Pseudomonas sp. NA-150 TaxID=3367525 RepID=UPI0037C51541